MQESMHMLLYRAFHAQRNILRPYMRALGLGAGQPKLIAYLAANGPCRQRDLAFIFDEGAPWGGGAVVSRGGGGGYGPVASATWRTTLKSIPRRFRGWWIRWKRAALSPSRRMEATAVAIC